MNKNGICGCSLRGISPWNLSKTKTMSPDIYRKLTGRTPKLLQHEPKPNTVSWFFLQAEHGLYQLAPQLLSIVGFAGPEGTKHM